MRHGALRPTLALKLSKHNGVQGELAAASECAVSQMHQKMTNRSNLQACSSQVCILAGIADYRCNS
eukprot:4956644-Amphidinium_carterae.1